ncbi:MAG: ammonium transporter [Candidatus Methanoplasma sp.]|jgi:Amt family ammonium transporter|nr:ammonium transporter [Candidatus Methanoplasma sp.]
MKIGIKIAVLMFLVLITVTILAPSASAESLEDYGIDVIDTVWILIASILVLMMAPALALFYGGMLRKQSMTSTLAQCTVAMAIVFLFWAMFGFSFAFDGSWHDGDFLGIIGGTDYLLMDGVAPNIPWGTLPSVLFLVFQGMFALVTAIIVLGAVAERVKFIPLMAYLALWCVFIYAPMTHMVWGGGALSSGIEDIFGWPVLDYAGGTVVHICSGVSGLAIAVVLGRRSKRIIKDRPHNIPFMYIGAVLLLLGWIGFNGGSGLAFNLTLMNVILVTLISSFVGMIAWAAVQILHAGRVSVSGLCAGMLAGLVGITPACGFVSPAGALIIGTVTSLACYFAILLMRKKSGIDDALDVFGLHGIGGITGALLTGLLAVNGWGGAGDGTVGAIYGNWALLGGQLVAVGGTFLYCFSVSFILMSVISKVFRFSGKSAILSEEEQQVGADIVEHGESAYN